MIFKTIGMKGFITQNKRSLYGGLAAAVFTGLGAFLLGDISGHEAKDLIETSLSGINMLCNTIILASATILALLLTLLGVSTGTNSQIKSAHYKQVLNIAQIDTILFVGALVMFQLFNIPITESDTLPMTWYDVVYWASLFFSSVLCGFMVTVILLLYTTVTNIISIVGLGEDHYLINEDEVKQEEEEEEEEEKGH